MLRNLKKTMPQNPGFGESVGDAALGAIPIYDFGEPMPDLSFLNEPAYSDGGGYDSGGGGGGTYYVEAAPPPPKLLAQSPEWLAYLNALGLEESQFRSDVDKRRGMARLMADQALGDIAFQGGLERRNISGSLETRGMSRSGEKVRRLSEQRAGEGRRQAGVETGFASTVTDLESQLAQKMMDLGARRAQQELELRAMGYV